MLFDFGGETTFGSRVIRRSYKVMQVIQFFFLRDQTQDARLGLVRAYQDLCEVFPSLMLVTSFIFCFKF